MRRKQRQGEVVMKEKLCEVIRLRDTGNRSTRDALFSAYEVSKTNLHGKNRAEERELGVAASDS